MNLDPSLVAFAAIVVAAYAVQTVTGFGSTLLSVSLGAMFLPIPEMLLLLVPISLLQTTYIAVRHRAEIRWSLLLKRVLPLMAVGLGIGYFGVRFVDGDWLRKAFGVLILVLSVRELAVLYLSGRRAKAREAAGAEPEEVTPIPLPASVLALIGAGVVHGIYATGGPLLVYAIGKEGLNKGEFRTTLCAVWLVLNIVLLSAYAVEGRYDADNLLSLAALLPAVPVGIFIGEKLHSRVPETTFKAAIFLLLVGAAFSLILR